ncbi:CHAD domain-containing protein [Rhodococcus hoagii]|nr:CHAD domain-containing protein [Prescottella equi]
MSLAVDVRADADDSVHQMRVSTRRLRSLLGSYKHAFPSEATRTARAELRWLGSVLGKARDAEVLAERFSALIDANPVTSSSGPCTSGWSGRNRTCTGPPTRARVESLDEPRFAALCALLDEITSGRHPVPAEVTCAPASTRPTASSARLRRRSADSSTTAPRRGRHCTGFASGPRNSGTPPRPSRLAERRRPMSAVPQRLCRRSWAITRTVCSPARGSSTRSRRPARTTRTPSRTGAVRHRGAAGRSCRRRAAAARQGDSARLRRLERKS